MATNSLQSLNYHHRNPHSPLRKQPIDTPPPSISIKLKGGNISNPSISISQSLFLSTTTFSLSSTTSSTSTPSTSSQSISFDLLRSHLSANDYREADEETRRLLIALAGEAAQKRGYVFFSEVRFIAESDLNTIDELWRNHSNNRFGYSVQKRIWEKSNMDFTRFFIKVGWMKKLDTEIEQYNYRAFPSEFIWELNEETPEGHLPLTNALRGTQLLNAILTHPAFAEEEEEEEEAAIEEEEQEEERMEDLKKSGGGFTKQQKPLGKGGVFKPDYSF